MSVLIQFISEIIGIMVRSRRVHIATQMSAVRWYSTTDSGISAQVHYQLLAAILVGC
jgi:hypothetical protein